MELTEREIKKGSDIAYEKAGHNAYFDNGFRAGIEFIQNREMKKWIPFTKENYDKFTELCNKEKCLFKFDDDTEVLSTTQSLPTAIMTHFCEI